MPPNSTSQRDYSFQKSRKYNIAVAYGIEHDYITATCSIRNTGSSHCSSIIIYYPFVLSVWLNSLSIPQLWICSHIVVSYMYTDTLVLRGSTSGASIIIHKILLGVTRLYNDLLHFQGAIAARTYVTRKNKSKLFCTNFENKWFCTCSFFPQLQPFSRYDRNTDIKTTF